MFLSTFYDLFMTWKNGKLEQTLFIWKLIKLNLRVFCLLLESRNEFFIAFSMYTNGGKIFKCSRSKSENVLECINGIRSLSIIWVIFGHSYLTSILRPQINLIELFDVS